MYLITISPIIRCIRILLPILPMIIDSLTTIQAIANIYEYSHTHMNIHIYDTLSVHLFIMTYVILSLFPYSCICLYCHAHIHKYTHTNKHTYVHTLTHIFICYECILHAQDRHVQLRSPRHQLYEVLGMSVDSTPRYHLKEVVPSGVLHICVYYY